MPLTRVDELARVEQVRIGSFGWCVKGFHVHPRLVGATDTAGAFIRKMDEPSPTFKQMFTRANLPAGIVNENGTGQFPSQGDEGCYAYAIAPSNHQVHYAVFLGRALKSTNAGATWTQMTLPTLNPGSVNSNYQAPYRYTRNVMNVDPFNENRVYLCTISNGVLYSADGATFAAVGSIPIPGAPPSDRPGPTIIFDPSSGSTGAGAAQRCNRVLAHSFGNGFYIDENGDGTFAALSPQISNATSADHTVNCMDIDASGNLYVIWSHYLHHGSIGTERFWMFQKSNSTWINRTANVDSSGNPIVAISISKHSSGRTAIVRSNGGLRVSGDFGATAFVNAGQFNAIRLAPNFPAIQGANESYMAVGDITWSDNPAEPNRLYFFQGIGVWYTDVPTNPVADWQVTWTYIGDDIEQLVTTSVLCCSNGKNYGGVMDRTIVPLTETGLPPPAYYGTAGQQLSQPGGAMHESVAGIISWNAQGASVIGYTANHFQTEVYPTGQGLTDFGAFAGLGRGESLWISTSIGITIPGFQKYPKRTTNGINGPWVDLVLPGGPTPPDGLMFNFALGTPRWAIAQDTVDGNIVYLYGTGSGGGIWRSLDAGASWTRVFIGEVGDIDGGYNGKIKAVPGKKNWLMNATGHVGGPTDFSATGVLKLSKDGGATWTTFDGVLEVWDFDFGAQCGGNSVPALYVRGMVDNVWGMHRCENFVASTQNWFTMSKNLPVGVFPPFNLGADKIRPRLVFEGLSGGTGFIRYDGARQGKRMLRAPRAA